MAAKGTFRLKDPLGVEMTLSVTMSMREWKIIAERLLPTQSDADWQLNDTIHRMLDQANKEFRFYEQVERTEG